MNDIEILIKLYGNIRLPHLEEEIFSDITTAQIYINALMEYEAPDNQVGQSICYYAVNIIRDRWLAAEQLILTNVEWAYLYARDVIKGRWPAAEYIILTDAQYSYCYATSIIKGRWPEAEHIICKDIEYCISYRHWCAMWDTEKNHE